jgi:hypothetical protein
MRLIIDRFEGDFAVCENDNKIMVNISKKELPSEVKEGDVIYKYDEKYIIDLEETKKRKQEIHDIIKNLWE